MAEVIKEKENIIYKTSYISSDSNIKEESVNLVKTCLSMDVTITFELMDDLVE